MIIVVSYNLFEIIYEYVLVRREEKLGEMLGSVPQRAQPLSPVASGSAGHSEETARDNLEEGGDDVKSSCPL